MAASILCPHVGTSSLTLTLAVPGANPPRPLEQIDVKEDKILLGRGKQCGVVLAGREYGASAEHARVEELGGTWYLFDQGSTNGTALNGTRIRPHTSVPLTNNDKIYIGRWQIKCSIRMATARHWAKGQAEDPRALAIVERLKAIGDPGQLVTTLKELLGHIEPHERGNVLRQVEARAQGGPVQEAVAHVIETREGIREACYQAFSMLSAHHTGQEEEFSSAEEVLRFFRLADQSLEMMLEWIVGCISSRRTFEEKFSAKVTRFFGMGANPIKHAMMPQQAGRYLLNWADERDAEEIKRNLESALQDLTHHQLALIAGVQASLKTALKQLDPDELEKEATGFNKRGKAWDKFKANYHELFNNDSKLYNEIIYPSLRQGYLEAHEMHLSADPDAVATPASPAPGADNATHVVPLAPPAAAPHPAMMPTPQPAPPPTAHSPIPTPQPAPPPQRPPMPPPPPPPR